MKITVAGKRPGAHTPPTTAISTEPTAASNVTEAGKPREDHRGGKAARHPHPTYHGDLA